MKKKDDEEELSATLCFVLIIVSVNLNKHSYVLILLNQLLQLITYMLHWATLFFLVGLLLEETRVVKDGKVWRVTIQR